MNVSLQQQMSIHNSWGWIWVYSRIAFGQSGAKDSCISAKIWGEKQKKKLSIWLFKSHVWTSILYRPHGCTCHGSLNALWQYWLHWKLFPFLPAFFFPLTRCSTVHYFWHPPCSALPRNLTLHFQHFLFFLHWKIFILSCKFPPNSSEMLAPLC